MRKRYSRKLFEFKALQLVRLGALAPSCHNTQPWKFSIGKDNIRISADYSRCLRTADPQNRSLYLSLGCVTANIQIAAAYFGFSTEVTLVAGQEAEAVVVRFGSDETPSSAADVLMSGMALRQCNRRPFEGSPITSSRLRGLVSAGKQPGVDLDIVTDRAQIEKVAQTVQDAKREHMTTEAFAELASWTRFNRREAGRCRDGLIFNEMGYPAMPRALGLILLAAVIRANRQSWRSAALISSSSALAVFAPQKDDQFHWFSVGRSFQRVVLTAASLGIRYAHLELPYSAPASTRDLAWRLGLEGRLLIVRLGLSDLGSYTLRRPLSKILVREAA